ncbi:MAG TPA: SCO family protein [Ideonella sp.]|nr:SCO family protein [Ideonella sp.]
MHAAPRLGPTAAACAAVLLLFAAALWSLTRGFQAWTFDEARRLQARAGERSAAPLTLLGAGGPHAAPWGLPTAAPAVTLVDFIYTRCPGVCQALGSEYEQMQRELAPGGAVRLLSISIDPAHDGPAELSAYAARHHADPARWTLGVPNSDAALQGLLRSLGVVAVPDGTGGFVHNGAIHLIDARGRLRGLHGHAEWREALAAAQAQVQTPR